MKTSQDSKRDFRALLAAQFFGALNDNLYKFSISFLLLQHYGEQDGDPGFHLYLLSAVFTLPFLIFAPYSGFLADRFSKATIIRWVKIAEIIIMGVGSYFLLNFNVSACYLLLFLMGLHSTIFSPAKYGIIPEIIEAQQLSKGNGYLQLLTFLAIIIGSALAGVLMANADGASYLPAFVIVLVSVLGLVCALLIGKTPAASPARVFDPNPFREFWSTFRKIRAERSTYLVVQGINYFWMLGAVLQPTILLFAKESLSLGETGSGALLAICGIGIGVGSVFAGKVSEGKVELGLLPLGSLGLTLTLLGLSIFSGNLYLCGVLVFLLGISAGTFIVPLNAFLQKESPEAERGSYLATTSFLNSAAMLLGSLLLMGLGRMAPISSAQTFLLFALITLAVSIYITRTLPGVFVRCVNWILTHTVYSISVLGKENVPQRGGALIVCNHVSFVDAQLLLASLDRPVRFLMHRPIYENRIINPVAKAAGAIPISKSDGKGGVQHALDQARESILRGELVGIFAEGSISRTGHLLPFKHGFESIMNGLDAPIIPAYIDRLWGSVFSFRGGKFLWKRPKKVPYPITVSFGKQLRAETKAFELRSRVQELSVETFKARERVRELLPYSFLEQLRSSPFRRCLKYSDGGGESYLGLFSRAVLLAKQLKSSVLPGDVVALSLSNGADAIAANLALSFLGAVPFNLPLGELDGKWLRLLNQSNPKLIVCDQPLASLENSIRRFDLGALTRHRSITHRLLFELAALILPGSVLYKLFTCRGQNPDSVALLVATRGRKGEPKLVQLSHSNISSNLEAIADILQLNSSDTIFAPLPRWHGYGAVSNLWLPLLSGMALVAGEPADIDRLSDSLSRCQVTTVFEQSFRLELYAKFDAGKKSRLQRMLVGGDKVDSKLSLEVEQKLGIEVFEGFGSSELTAIALLNVGSYGDGKHQQKGGKECSIGHPLPGVAVKIVDTKHGAPVALGESGLLAVKGNSVMLGYLGSGLGTQNRIESGWFLTDDIARIDEDGFVELIQRA